MSANFLVFVTDDGGHVNLKALLALLFDMHCASLGYRKTNMMPFWHDKIMFVLFVRIPKPRVVLMVGNGIGGD